MMNVPLQECESLRGGDDESGNNGGGCGGGEGITPPEDMFCGVHRDCESVRHRCRQRRSALGDFPRLDSGDG